MQSLAQHFPILTEIVITAVSSLVISYLAIRLIVFLLKRWQSPPPGVAWIRQFVLPLTVAIFLASIENRLDIKTRIEGAGLVSWSRAVLVLAAYLFLNSVARFLIRYLRLHFDISTPDNLANRMKQTRLQFVNKLLHIGLALLAFAFFLLCFDSARKLGTSLLASAGVLGLVVGFASQKMVANLLAGFQIAFSQPLRLDDAVVIDNEWGWVEEIALTYVVVRLWDLRRLIVPLSRLLEQPFQNWTRHDAKIIGTVFLKTSHLAPVDGIRDELDRILSVEPAKSLWNGETKVVQVTDSTDFTMEVRVLVSSQNSSKAFDLRCLVREKLIDYLVKLNPDFIGEVRMKSQAGEPPGR